MFTDRGMDKEYVVVIYNGILLSHKKEWSKPDKDKYHMISLICGI